MFLSLIVVFRSIGAPSDPHPPRSVSARRYRKSEPGSYGFLAVFLRFSYGFLTARRYRKNEPDSYVFLTVFLRHEEHFFTVFLRFSYGFLAVSMVTWCRHRRHD